MSYSGFPMSRKTQEEMSDAVGHFRALGIDYVELRAIHNGRTYTFTAGMGRWKRFLQRFRRPMITGEF